MIIVGVLATISLKNIFIWIEKSKSAEILPILQKLANQADACVLSKGLSDVNISNCINQTPLPINSKYFSLLKSFIFSSTPNQGYIISFKNNSNGTAAQNVVTCPNAMSFTYLNTPGPQANGVIGICSYPNDGSNVNPNKGKHILVGSYPFADIL